ncbi:MAG: hypothetical protein DDT23_00024 [candidate division WS2 bacterium]|nr:hypothetical protein [Candidatus Lithacetigena glycinireducens]
MELPLKMVKGDSFRRKITFFDGTTRRVVDISNWTLFFTVKRPEYLDKDDSVAEIRKTETIRAGQGTSGIWILEILPADTTTVKDVQPGLYKYDVQYRRPDGTIKTVTVSDFEIAPQVTVRTT